MLSYKEKAEKAQSREDSLRSFMADYRIDDLVHHASSPSRAAKKTHSLSPINADVKKAVIIDKVDFTLLFKHGIIRERGRDDVFSNIKKTILVQFPDGTLAKLYLKDGSSGMLEPESFEMINEKELEEELQLLAKVAGAREAKAAVFSGVGIS